MNNRVDMDVRSGFAGDVGGPVTEAVMYHRIVAAKVRAVFAEINKGNYEPMLASLAPEFSYRFYGSHALSGERRTAAAMRLWWERVFRLIPDARFEVDEVIVAGGPWFTRIATVAHVSGPLPDGTRYENTVNQILHMRWGKITKIRTLEDTVTLQRALDAVAVAGNAEAHAAPITDDSAAQESVTS
ncbi:nuclear transport factor 2 family protein [Micromonospora tarensis]|uniref:Nuclear transport factor 2 family protein n=1 Tax=Micromonospora tarensis TaxID=2806100 RepID=A0ABS1YEQ5_9ACTN|nr:nuclear transport factor 2 family protein [Micromonospora tarensis]MBM0275901.1 nuclear transport factor 2 family protein [Micromonospora tarensis]